MLVTLQLNAMTVFHRTRAGVGAIVSINSSVFAAIHPFVCPCLRFLCVHPPTVCLLACLPFPVVAAMIAFLARDANDLVSALVLNCALCLSEITNNSSVQHIVTAGSHQETATIHSELAKSLFDIHTIRPLICQQCAQTETCLLYTSPSPRDLSTSRMPSSA